MTRAKSERIARFAFDFAIKNNRKVGCSRPGLLEPRVLIAASHQDRHLRSQGEHHEARRRTFPQHLQEGR